MISLELSLPAAETFPENPEVATHEVPRILWNPKILKVFA
jgi:hypothetical protein